MIGDDIVFQQGDQRRESPNMQDNVRLAIISSHKIVNSSQGWRDYRQPFKGQQLHNFETHVGSTTVSSVTYDKAQ